MRSLMLRGFLGVLVSIGFFVVYIHAQEVKQAASPTPPAPAPAKTVATPVIPTAAKPVVTKQPVTAPVSAPTVTIAKPSTPASVPAAAPAKEPQKAPAKVKPATKPTIPTVAPSAPKVQTPAVTVPATPAAVMPVAPVTVPSAAVATPVDVEDPFPTPIEPVEAAPGVPEAAAGIPEPTIEKIPEPKPMPSVKISPAQPPKPLIPSPVPVPAKPTAIAPQAVPAESVASEEFDTSKIKEYGGNWYFKRAWWENAEREYEKARQVLEQLFEVRMTFFEKRNELERTLFEPFYRNMGFEQGELQDVLVYLIDQIEEERKEEGTLDIKEREFLTTLQEEKNTLEQLKLDMEQFSKFDDAIDDAVNMLIKQINQARQYEQAAWKEFKAIAEDLSDTKARERYYTIRTLYKNIKNIYDYVRGDFKKYFENLEDVSRKEAERIRANVKSLKNKGIDLKEQAKKLVEEPLSTPAPTPEPPKVEETEEHGYFMGTIYWVGGALKSTWNLIFGWLYPL